MAVRMVAAVVLLQVSGSSHGTMRTRRNVRVECEFCLGQSFQTPCSHRCDIDRCGTEDGV